MLANAQGCDWFLASVNLHVDFLGQVREGNVLFAVAEVVRNGNNIVNMQVELRHADGRLIARASSNLCNTRLPNPFK